MLKVKNFKKSKKEKLYKILMQPHSEEHLHLEVYI